MFNLLPAILALRVDIDPVVVGAIISVVATISTLLFTRRKTRAETADVLTQAAERITNMLTEQLTAASHEVAALHEQLRISTARVTALTVDIDRLTQQVWLLRAALIRHGGDPDEALKGRSDSVN